jgi:hypothetical protein
MTAVCLQHVPFEGLGSFAAALTQRGAAIEHHLVPKDVKNDLGSATVLTVKRAEAVPSASASNEGLHCSASAQRSRQTGLHCAYSQSAQASCTSVLLLLCM